MDFVKIASDFEILAKQKQQHKNGIHLRSLMIFYLMCKHDGETISSIYKRFYPTYHHQPIERIHIGCPLLDQHLNLPYFG